MTDKHKISSAKIQRYYRPLLVVFTIVSCLIVGAIAYFSFSRTIITVTPKESPTILTVSFTVAGSPVTASADGYNIITGSIFKHTQKLIKSFSDLTTLSSVPAKAGGSVTIYNKNNKAQPLVAGTRLISRAGKLFRTTKRIDVPIGGSVVVDVIADQAGKDYEIPADHFTLPGLWEGLQDKIYGESTIAMVGGTTDTKVASINDIEKAKEAVRTEMYELGLSELSSQVKKVNADWLISAVRKEILTEEVNTEPNQATSTIEVSSSINLLGVAFDLTNTEQMILNKANEQIDAEDSFVRENDQPITYTLERYDPKTNQAVIKALVSGLSSVKITNPMFDRKNLINKDRQEIASYFSRFDEIESVDVRFSPFWLMRAPSLANRIEVRLK